MALLASPSLAAPPTPKVTFEARDNHGIRKLIVNDRNYVVGCGFGLIGSVSGVDDYNNITSCCDAAKNGDLHPFNNNHTIPPLPFRLTFKPGKSTNSIVFEVSVGPAAADYATVSLPFDCERNAFTHVQFPTIGYETGGYDGSCGGEKIPKTTHPGNRVAFADLKSAYCHIETRKPVRIGRAVGRPKWGRLIGKDLTIEVRTEKQSRPLDFYFVDHEGIGVRNLEFSLGSLKKGEKVTFSGTVRVLPPETK